MGIDDPQTDVQGRADSPGLALQKPAQPLRRRYCPLPHRQRRKGLIRCEAAGGLPRNCGIYRTRRVVSRATCPGSFSLYILWLESPFSPKVGSARGTRCCLSGCSREAGVDNRDMCSARNETCRTGASRPGGLSGVPKSRHPCGSDFFNREPWPCAVHQRPSNPERPYRDCESLTIEKGWAVALHTSVAAAPHASTSTWIRS